MMGAAIGLAIGLIAGASSYMMLAKLAGRVEKDETKEVLKIVGVMDLVLFPLMGFLIGAYVFG